MAASHRWEALQTQLSGMRAAEHTPVLLALQQTHGNQYVQRVVSGIQAKLKVRQPEDIYEREADQVTDAVMRMSGVRRQVKWDIPTFALANSSRLHPMYTCGNYTDVVSP